MTITEKDLFLAILAMDSYNRGGGAGINDGGASDTNGFGDSSDGSIKIGNATITHNLQDAGIVDASEAAGFYAVAYQTDYGTVISYRGTDSAPGADLATDAHHGWTLGGGNFFAAQKDADNEKSPSPSRRHLHLHQKLGPRKSADNHQR
jgi:hypothetical protein